MNQYRRLDAAELRRRASGNWESIYARLASGLVDAMAKPGRHVPCPVHGGTDGFRLKKDSRDGAGICNTCEEFDGSWMDGFGILMWINRWPFPKVLEEVAQIIAPDLLDGKAERRSYVPLPPVPRKSPQEVKAELLESLEKVRRMRDVWVSGIPITDRKAIIAQRYFESRGLKPPTEKDGYTDLRFVPSLYYTDGEEGHGGQRFPAIVALARNSRGMVVAMHRTYLAPDGAGKAPVSEPKKLMAKPEQVPMSEAAIRLGAVTSPLAVAEGIETAMAVHAFTGFTCWACISSSIMRSFAPPEGVRGVHIFGDLDVSQGGERAVEALAESLQSHGLTVRCDVPKGPIPEGRKGVDWLDVYRDFGKAALYEVPSLAKFRPTADIIPFKRA